MNEPLWAEASLQHLPVSCWPSLPQPTPHPARPSLGARTSQAAPGLLLRAAGHLCRQAGQIAVI